MAAQSHHLPAHCLPLETVDCGRVSVLHLPLGLVTQSLWRATVSWDVGEGGHGLEVWGPELGGHRTEERVWEAWLGIRPGEGLTTPWPGGFQDEGEDFPWAVTGPGDEGHIPQKNPGAQ